LRHRLAEFLAADPERSGSRSQQVFGDLWSGNFVRALRLASRACIQGRTATNRIALLHERRRAVIPRSVVRAGDPRFAARVSGSALITDPGCKLCWKMLR